MKKLFQWIKDNPNRVMFLVPILLVAGISISHVVSWYDIANPINWAIYLSIAIEVAAMTALVAATNRIKGGVWFMFILVTIIQMIGNIFFSFKEIDENGELFKSWMELTSPLWEILGSDPTDISSQKRWLAFLEGGLLPIISLTSLHFFTKYDKNQSDNKEEVKESPVITEPDKDLTDEEYEQVLQDFIRKQKEQEEKLKYTPKEEDFKKLDDFLSQMGYDGPKKTEVDNSTEFAPNEDELSKIEEILSKFSQPEAVEIKEDIEEDEVEKVFFEPVEDIVEEEPVIIEPQIVEEPLVETVVEPIDELYDDILEEEIQEIKPEPVEEVKTYKVLNYFK
jgi:hypothetical protein